MAGHQNLSGIVLSDDLLFSSQITGTAKALGLPLRVAGSPDVLLQMNANSPATGIILDLAFPQLNLIELLQTLRAQGSTARVMAYGSHVDVETLKAAREAGCDPVLPRSAFVEKLSSELPTWLGKQGGEG